MPGPMTDPVTLRLPEPLLQQAREIAAVTGQTLQEVLLDWLEFALHQQATGHRIDPAKIDDTKIDGLGTGV